MRDSKNNVQQIMTITIIIHVTKANYVIIMHNMRDSSTTKFADVHF